MNKILQNTIYFFVAIIVIWAGFQNQVFAQSFYSDSNDHYSFTLPNGWKEIPKNIIDQFVAKVVQQTQGQLNIKYDSGFQLADKEYFQHPYFLIQEYSINSPSYNEIEKMLNDANFSKEKERVTEKYSEFFGNFNFDKPFIDKQKGMVFMNINASVPNAGAVKGLLAIFLGDKHTTRLFFYTLETEYSQWLPAFKSIVDSFQYETNYAYNPTKAIKNDSPYILDAESPKKSREVLSLLELSDLLL